MFATNNESGGSKEQGTPSGSLLWVVGTYMTWSIAYCFPGSTSAWSWNPKYSWDLTRGPLTWDIEVLGQWPLLNTVFKTCTFPYSKWRRENCSHFPLALQMSMLRGAVPGHKPGAGNLLQISRVGGSSLISWIVTTASQGLHYQEVRVELELGVRWEPLCGPQAS